ncbi:MAG: hypothetical protein L0Y72_04510 [Gemmataceae bacterium]|nr:hypothetical protein [Gemmataceae bacterium]MCI0738283.1 hypothetical protein [Gemmataceae bacterium]
MMQMESPENNLLVRLHKWASRQDENFLTEAFAHLGQHLLDHESEAGVGLIAFLTAGRIQLKPEEAKLVDVRTQIVQGEGTPDIEFRTPRHFAIIEVKSESEAHIGQLRKYRGILDQSGIDEKCLVLLTRYPVSFEGSPVQPDVFRRWHEIAEWLRQQSVERTFKAVSEFLVRQFRGFLEERNMSIGQVTWELSGGVKALRTLGDMLYEAAKACGTSAYIEATLQYFGVYLENRKYWIGVDMGHPEILCFSTDKARVDKEAAQRLEVGSVFEWKDKKAFGWYREVNLESEEVHFFSRSKVGQLQYLEAFLKECVSIVGSIEVATASTADESGELANS